MKPQLGCFCRNEYIKMKPVSIIILVANPGTITPKMEKSPEMGGIKSHLYLGQTTKQISELRRGKTNKHSEIVLHDATTYQRKINR